MSRTSPRCGSPFAGITLVFSCFVLAAFGLCGCDGPSFSVTEDVPSSGTASSNPAPSALVETFDADAVRYEIAAQPPAVEETSTDEAIDSDALTDEPTKTNAMATGEATDDAPATIGTRPGGDWPTFLGPTGDSISRETGIRTDWSAGLPIVWQRELGPTYGTVAIAYGRCVFAERIDDTLHIRAVNAETGESLWESLFPMEYEDLYGYDGGPRSSPMIDGGRVFLHNVDGKFYCLALEDGRTLWTRDLSTEYHVVPNFFGVGSSPVVENDLILIMVGGSPASQASLPAGAVDQAKPAGAAIVALDKRTGGFVWKTGDDLASYGALRVATIADQRHGLAYCRGGLLDFDPNSGDVRYTFPWRSKKFESVSAATPVVVGDEVLLTETYGPGGVVLKLDHQKPTVVWSDADRGREQALLCHMNTPVVVDGYCYGSSGRHSGDAELRCVTWEAGKVKWSEPDLSRSSLLAIDGHLICLTEYGELLLLKTDPTKYDRVSSWIPLKSDADTTSNPTDPRQRLLRYPAWSAPVVSHGLMYLRGDGRLLCVELIPEKSDKS